MDKKYWQSIGNYFFLLVIGSTTAIITGYIIKNFDFMAINTCQDNEIIYSDWSECIDGFQVRKITHSPICRVPKNIQLSKQCFSVWGVSLFEERIKTYTTQIDLSAKNPLAINYGNLAIKPVGSFSGAKLLITSETTIKDGTPYKVGEFYYYFFGLNEAIPRVIATSRISYNKLDTSDIGVFQGTETPKLLLLDLSPAKMAKISDQGLGYDEINYVNILNENEGRILKMTIFMADGQSMIEPDEAKRIFGTITSAQILYECKKGSNCKIERVPTLSTPLIKAPTSSASVRTRVRTKP